MNIAGIVGHFSQTTNFCRAYKKDAMFDVVLMTYNTIHTRKILDIFHWFLPFIRLHGNSICLNPTSDLAVEARNKQWFRGKQHHILRMQTAFEVVNGDSFRFYQELLVPYCFKQLIFNACGCFFRVCIVFRILVDNRRWKCGPLYFSWNKRASNNKNVSNFFFHVHIFTMRYTR